jgi:hypothetical protein
VSERLEVRPAARSAASSASVGLGVMDVASKELCAD